MSELRSTRGSGPALTGDSEDINGERAEVENELGDIDDPKSKIGCNSHVPSVGARLEHNVFPNRVNYRTRTSKQQEHSKHKYGRIKEDKVDT